jgi:hypothetical protein
VNLHRESDARQQMQKLLRSFNCSIWHRGIVSWHKRASEPESTAVPIAETARAMRDKELK